MQKVYYGGAVYNSTKQLMVLYNDPDSGIKKVKFAASDLPVPGEEYPASFEMKGDMRPGSNTTGPMLYQPGGRRFTLAGSQVSWLGWDFDVAMRVSGGIQLWDVNFKGERIAYEIGFEVRAHWYCYSIIIIAGWSLHTPTGGSTIAACRIATLLCTGCTWCLEVR